MYWVCLGRSAFMTAPLAQIVGAIDPLLRPTTTVLSHVQEHLRLKQRGSGPRSGPKMEMESTLVEIPTSKCLLQRGTRLPIPIRQV